MEASDQQQSPPFLSPQSVPALGGVNQDPERPAAAAAAAAAVKGRPGGGAVKKASKRKTRAATKPPIRVVSADKSSFRDIVLQLTGVPQPGGGGHSTSSCSSKSNPQNDGHPQNEGGHSSLGNSPPNDVRSQNQYGRLHQNDDAHSFLNPVTSLSSSHTHPCPLPPHSFTSPISPSIFHMSPYAHALPHTLRNPNMDSPSDHQDAMMMQSAIIFSKSLAILQALRRRSLTHITGGEGCGSSSHAGGLPGRCNQYDSDLDDASTNHKFGLVDFETPLITSREYQTPKSIINTDLLGMEHSHKSWQAAELESFLLTGNDAAR